MKYWAYSMDASAGAIGPTPERACTKLAAILPGKQMLKVRALAFPVAAVVNGEPYNSKGRRAWVGELPSIYVKRDGKWEFVAHASRALKEAGVPAAPAS